MQSINLIYQSINQWQAYYLLFIIYYLLLNRTRSTEYSMKINNLRSQLARANVRDNVVQLVVR